VLGGTVHPSGGMTSIELIAFVMHDLELRAPHAIGRLCRGLILFLGEQILQYLAVTLALGSFGARHTIPDTDKLTIDILQTGSD